MRRKALYVMVYGVEGSGKTCLAMTLADKDKKGVGYITHESSGPTSLVSIGYPADTPVELLTPGIDPFPETYKALREMAKDPTIQTICLDNVTAICGNAVMFYSDGEGDKQMGYDGWGYVKAGFMGISAECDKITRAGKSVVITAWEREPSYENTKGGQVLKDVGRPQLQGDAKHWVPGNADLIARISSKFVSEIDPVTKKNKKTFKSSLQVHASGLFLAKTRWALPNPCPADLKFILKEISKQTSPLKEPAEGKVIKLK